MGDDDQEQYETLTIPPTILSEFKSEKNVPFNLTHNIKYSLNFARIVQGNKVETIFKNVPCPPKGKMSDFYFEHPVREAREHWHFTKLASKPFGRDDMLGFENEVASESSIRGSITEEPTGITWRRYKTLEDGSSKLYFINASPRIVKI